MKYPIASINKWHPENIIFYRLVTRVSYRKSLIFPASSTYIVSVNRQFRYCRKLIFRLLVIDSRISVLCTICSHRKICRRPQMASGFQYIMKSNSSIGRRPIMEIVCQSATKRLACHTPLDVDTNNSRSNNLSHASGGNSRHDMVPLHNHSSPYHFILSARSPLHRLNYRKLM